MAKHCHSGCAPAGGAASGSQRDGFSDEGADNPPSGAAGIGPANAHEVAPGSAEPYGTNLAGYRRGRRGPNRVTPFQAKVTKIQDRDDPWPRPVGTAYWVWLESWQSVTKSLISVTFVLSNGGVQGGAV